MTSACDVVKSRAPSKVSCNAGAPSAAFTKSLRTCDADPRWSALQGNGWACRHDLHDDLHDSPLSGAPHRFRLDRRRSPGDDPPDVAPGLGIATGILPVALR